MIRLIWNSFHNMRFGGEWINDAREIDFPHSYKGALFIGPLVIDLWWEKK